MKYTFFLALILFNNALSAQIDTNLYYKVDTINQLYGIIKGDGSTIIPVVHHNWFGYENGELCSDSVIAVFVESTMSANFRKLNATALIGTSIYDRTGKLLTYPYYDFYYEKSNPWQPFKEYILERLIEAKDYFKSYPHAENKFEVDKYLSIYQ